MDIEKKIEEVGGIGITDNFIANKDRTFDVHNYLNVNNLQLPEEYIDFSLKYGFGQFGKEVVFKSVADIPIAYDDGTVPVTFIYGWGSGSESLQDTREALLDQLDSDCFVFAESSPGDYLLINMSDNRIYYYIHDNSMADSLFLAANSFSEFIGSLKVKDCSDSVNDEIEEEWFSDNF